MIRSLLLSLVWPVIATIVIVVIANGMKSVLQSRFRSIINLAETVLLLLIWLPLLVRVAVMLINQVPF